MAWDDNVFRLPSSAPSSSDRIASAYVGLHLDKPYGQQRFLMNVTQGAVRYQKFSYLNFNPLSYDGAWLWQLSPRVSGTLTTAHEESLYRFEDSHNITQRTLSTTDNSRFSVDGRVFGGWHIVGAALYDKTDNTPPVPQTPNYRASGGEGGLNYVARSGSSIGFNYRARHGEYRDRPLDAVLQLDDGFESKEWGLLVNWRCIEPDRARRVVRLSRDAFFGTRFFGPDRIACLQLDADRQIEFRIFGQSRARSLLVQFVELQGNRRVLSGARLETGRKDLRSHGTGLSN